MAVYIAMFLKVRLLLRHFFNSNLREVLCTRVLSDFRFYICSIEYVIGMVTDFHTLAPQILGKYFGIKILTGLNAPMI